MPIIKKQTLQVDLDSNWPRIVSISKLDTGAAMAGCRPGADFEIELNGEIYHGAQLSCKIIDAEESLARYMLHVDGISLFLFFVFRLEDDTIKFSLEKVIEDGDFKLESFYIPNHNLVTGTSKNNDSYLRNCSNNRINWGRSWVPGVSGGGFEDFGPVSGGTAERWPRPTVNACIWNEGMCVSFISSIYSEPLVSMLSGEAQLLGNRAGSFSVWSDTYHYRLMGKPAKPFELIIGVFGDYNKNGKIDWCDAAAWRGDYNLPKEFRYKDTILYKIFVDDVTQSNPPKTFDECLLIVKQIHQISRGLKQIVYLVGWQYNGHDTGYPSFDVVSERAGGLSGLRKLIEDAKQYNCVISLHINMDDSYESHPNHNEEIVGRDADAKKHLWYFNYENGGRSVYSISHTLAVESGYNRRRIEKLLELLPIVESIHSDAHRPNETWLESGTHISVECEYQLGIHKIREMFAERGIDVTVESISADPHWKCVWGWHAGDAKNYFNTVMGHGRCFGYHRPGMEGMALGSGYVWAEKGWDTYEETTKNFYLHWMYGQILFRKKMVDYVIGAWNQGAQAWYEDDTRVESQMSGRNFGELEAWYEGIQIAKGNTRFLPFRDNEIYFYSVDGGSQAWELPASWEGKPIKCRLLRRSGTVEWNDYSVEGRKISFVAPKGLAILFSM